MEKVTLKNKDIIALASMSDKNFLYGMKDILITMSVSDIKKMIDDAKLNLDEMGYINCDFNGNVSITTFGNEILDRLVREKYYTYCDTLIDGIRKDRLAYYKNEKLETICEYSGENILIEDLDRDVYIDRIFTKYFNRCNNETYEEKDIKVSKDKLSSVSNIYNDSKENATFNEIVSKSKKILGLDDVANLLVETILMGFAKKCNYVSFSCGSIENRKMICAQFVISDNAIIMYENNMDDLDKFEVKLVKKSNVHDLLNGLVSRLE